MKRLAALVGLLALLVAGCGTLVNHAQYQIRPASRTQPKSAAVVPAGERDAVKQILQTVANEFHFEDRTKSSLVPNVIGAYSQRDELYPITFVGWVHEGSVIVDVLHQPYSVGETPKYREVRERMLKLLQDRFGSRTVLSPRDQQIRSVPAK
jgi:hypothetical protein